MKIHRDKKIEARLPAKGEKGPIPDELLSAEPPEGTGLEPEASPAPEGTGTEPESSPHAIQPREHT